MDKFVTWTTKKTEDAAPAEKNKTNSNQPKSQPKRKYDEDYLALGFTVEVVGAEERPVLCFVS